MEKASENTSLQTEHWDAAADAGQEVDWDLYARITGHCRRVFETLGIERRMRVVQDGSDTLLKTHGLQR